MAEITLSDYLGYLFAEISKARDMADRYSKEIALAYAKDDILRHFSVPRFKIPKLDLTIPVLVSGMQLSATSFRMSAEDFRQLVVGKAIALATTVRDNKIVIVTPVPGPTPVVRTRASREGPGTSPVDPNRPAPIRADGLNDLAAQFYQALAANQEQSSLDGIIDNHWLVIVDKVLSANGLGAEYARQNPNNELFKQTMSVLAASIKANFGTSKKATIDTLLVNPETNVIRNGSDAASVFTIRAELMEEGLFVKSFTDESGAESHIVEFE